MLPARVVKRQPHAHGHEPPAAYGCASAPAVPCWSPTAARTQASPQGARPGRKCAHSCPTASSRVRKRRSLPLTDELARVVHDAQAALVVHGHVVEGLQRGRGRVDGEHGALRRGTRHRAAMLGQPPAAIWCCGRCPPPQAGAPGLRRPRFPLAAWRPRRLLVCAFSRSPDGPQCRPILSLRSYRP
jgi:hypothetical protein